MKKLITLILLVVVSINSYSQPLVYFNFISHDEDTGPWNNPSYYAADRAKLISLSTYFQTKGITFNLQSDYLYLTNVLSKDPALISATTNNKNILRWMAEDMGVEIDPHSHEKIYIYPDIVKLMDSIGLPESKLMGGSLYGEKNGINVWSNLINGQYGVVFPNKFWAPDYIMGGGSKNHVADLNYYGFWNPKDTDNYLTHYPANHLRHIGTGCEIKIDTSSVAVIVAEIKDVVQKVQSGQYPSNGFYVQTIFFGHGDLNNTAFYNKLIEVADSVNAIVATGKAQWKTLKQAYTLWETVYSAQMFQWECGEIFNDVSEIAGENTTVIYPNPFSNAATLQIIPQGGKVITNSELKMYDLFGREIRKYEIKNQKTEILREDLPSGMYFYCVTDKQQVIGNGKIIIQ